MYLLEMVGGVILPLAILLGCSKKEECISGVMSGHALVVGGVLLNSFNVSISGMYGFQSAMGATYWPSMIEIVITWPLLLWGFFYLYSGRNFCRFFLRQRRKLTVKVYQVRKGPYTFSIMLMNIRSLRT